VINDLIKIRFNGISSAKRIKILKKTPLKIPSPAAAYQSNNQTIRYIQWLIGKGNKRLFFLTLYCLLLSTHWMYIMAYLFD